jgi:phytoene synthase
VPRPLRLHLARIYAYCRTTDDLGDESGDEAVWRLRLWQSEVEALFAGRSPVHPVLVALSDTVRRFGIPAEPFLDLIAANVQDQTVRAYQTWEELRAYCMLSAAPVGRMVLRLFEIDDPAALPLSDDLCVGLQLANFAQDVAVDRDKGRTYLIQDDIAGHGLPGAVEAMCRRALALLASGRRLERLAMPRRLRLQLSLYRRGGEAVIEAIRKDGFRTDTRRPEVSPAAKARLVADALRDDRLGGRSPAGGRLTAERYCRQLARREAGNFYWGFVALPRTQRVAIYALYGFARQLDDATDGPEPVGVAERLQRLEAHRSRLRRAVGGDPGDDPVMQVLGRAVHRHGIPLAELDELVSGVAMDLSRTRYASWDELRRYCHRVAGVVGQMCVRIFGSEDGGALERADDLGAALQLINILRDVREDAAMGRVYLPADDLARFGISEAALLAGEPGPAWPALIEHEAGRARGLYGSGIEVCGYIPAQARACVGTMAGIYSGILDRIEEDPELPLRRRVRLSTGEKAGVMVRSWMTATAAGLLR